MHPLSGDLKNHWDVSVNGNWRLAFTFDGTDAVQVDYMDYHLEYPMPRMFAPPHPGLMLRDDVLPALGLGVTQAAEQLGVSRVALSCMVNGRAAISPDMALRLEAWLGVERGGDARVGWHNKVPTTYGRPNNALRSNPCGFSRHQPLRDDTTLRFKDSNLQKNINKPQLPQDMRKQLRFS